jgi:hypothetical protein
MYYRLLTLLATAGLLTGCASQMDITAKPAETPEQSHGAPSANWENLGVSPNGNILNEIDKMSIQQHGSLVSFRDRKTIFNIRKENFQSTPPHKVSVNSWQIDCAAKTYRLTAMTLLDEKGRAIASFSYNDDQIKPMPVVQNSASYQQMLYVCHGTPAI